MTIIALVFGWPPSETKRLRFSELRFWAEVAKARAKALSPKAR